MVKGLAAITGDWKRETGFCRAARGSQVQMLPGDHDLELVNSPFPQASMFCKDKAKDC